MCGRYTLIPKKDPKGKSRAVKLLDQYREEAHYNAAPSQLLPVITGEAPNTLQFFS